MIGRILSPIFGKKLYAFFRRKYYSAKRRLFVLKNKIPFVSSMICPWISSKRIDILVPFSIWYPRKENIGDIHFAKAMRRELKRIGYKVKLIPMEFWGQRSNAHYVVRLKGWGRYAPPRLPKVKYILWNISHPDMLSIEECNLYDCVLFASERMSNEWRTKLCTRVDTMLQAADDITMARPIKVEHSADVLFIANSRGVFRQILQDLLPTKYDLAIIGEGWDGTPAEPYVKFKSIANVDIGEYYREAKIVLNDHWADMRQSGIVSNRCFDVLSAGGFVISDYMPEIWEIFGDCVKTYHDRNDLNRLIDYYLKNTEERQHIISRGRELVLKSHTFTQRMEQLAKILESM